MSGKVIEEIRKYIESGNINFIIGAGASIGAIKILGEIDTVSTTMTLRRFELKTSTLSR